MCSMNWRQSRMPARMMVTGTARSARYAGYFLGGGLSGSQSVDFREELTRDFH